MCAGSATEGSRRREVFTAFVFDVQSPTETLTPLILWEKRKVLHSASKRG